MMVDDRLKWDHVVNAVDSSQFTRFYESYVLLEIRSEIPIINYKKRRLH